MSRRSTRLATTVVSPSVTKIMTTATANPSVPKATALSAKSPSRALEKNNRDHKGSSTSSSPSSSSDDEDNVPKSKKRKVATVVKAKKANPPESMAVNDGKSRCIWAASAKYPLMQQYHDSEWCVPGGFNRTNRYLFEMIILEGAQAGLSWSTVLHKREAYREAYDHFDYNLIADHYTSPASNERLLKTNIVKNRLKVEASMINARAFRDLLQSLYPDQAKPEDENGFWQFLQAYRQPADNNGTNKNHKSTTDHESHAFITRNESSDRLSADLKKRGFKFVGKESTSG
ncbi:hypothetical protein EDD11_006126 [Mortierella claussenii]|nr:hypothetical protein EDD11_006126 [Mortierella claussenii]